MIGFDRRRRRGGTSTTAGFHRTGRPLAAVGAGFCLAAMLGACGGGGGGTESKVVPTQRMALSTHSIAVSATTEDPPPTARIDVVLAMQPTATLYVGTGIDGPGIDTVRLESSKATAATMLVTFRSPGEIGAGTHASRLAIAVCNDKDCNSQVGDSPQVVAVTYTVTVAPVVASSLSPVAAEAGGGGFLLTVAGSGFVPSSTVLWAGSARPTTFVSSRQVTAQILDTDLAQPGIATVTVSNDASGGGSSGALEFTIQPQPRPTIAVVSPSSVPVGSPPFVLTVTGAGFRPGCAVLWDGRPLPTTWISTGELTAQVGAGDVAATGSVAVTVRNPGSAGETSAAATLAISPGSVDAVSFQITPSHAGFVRFKSVTFPQASTWTVDLGGNPSYALIAAGRVFVTVSVTGASLLVALDQATGAIAWGPISMPGQANAAYDDGTVFVLSSVIGSAALLQAFDAADGRERWGTVLAGQYAFSSAPTAAHGMVYAAGAGSGGTLYAVRGSDGSIAWTRPVANGDSSTPAVTLDGVYVTYPCETYDFRPATGTLVWEDRTGCSGGGGASPVVGNGVIYAPNGSGTYDGTMLDAGTGQAVGRYAAGNPPAVGPEVGYFLQGGTLRGIRLASKTVLWSFAGDGTLVTSPIGVNQFAFVGSSSGDVIALDGTTGQQAWSARLGAPLPAGAGWGSRMPFSGLSAGDGLLVVPAGTTLTAYTLSVDP